MPTTIIPKKAPTLPPRDRKLAVGQIEAARLLDISDKTLRIWTRDGKIKARKCGGRVLYSMQALEEFLHGDSE